MLRISSDQHFKLNSLAEEADVSIEEIARRAIDSFQLKAMEEAQELEILAEAVIESNKKAIKSLKEAHEALQDTLAHFASLKG